MLNDIGKLKDIIAGKVFVKNSEEQIEIYNDPEKWIFDFRRVLMNGQTSELIAEIFYQQHKDKYPFQLGTLEIAGVPLMVSIMRKFYEHGHHDINAFFIRKSRKKSGLLRMIEGEILPNVEVILVDDIMNSGSSFWRQFEVLEPLGHKVKEVWSILRYRDLNFYQRFSNLGIEVQSLFTLNDFTEVLGDNIKNFGDLNSPPPNTPFELEWVFKSEKPSLSYVLSKSQPVLDEDNIYFGSDNCIFWAIKQTDGSVAWQYKVGQSINKKSIFSSPVIYQDLVIFGSYDGNIYALERSTGKRRWVCLEADWIGSSPAMAVDLGLVFVGLEYGLLRKRGGIVALDVKTGKVIWKDVHPAYTHASPLYIEEYQEVVIGSNDGKMRLYDARTGDKKWEFTTFGGASYDNKEVSGFGEGDIKERAVYDAEHDYIIFGSIDSFLYILDRKTGQLVQHYKCDFGIYSTPYIYKNKLYFTSTDKKVRCLDLDTLKLVFEIDVDHTRIFSTPTVINDRLYIGTNAGRLHELDPETGEKLAYFQAVERITNTVLYNPKIDKYFLPTYANEIIKLKRDPR